MKTIDREQLKAKLDRHQPVQLLMAHNQSAFDKAHIPGSLHFDQLQDAVQCLSPDQEVVVYCTGPNCAASYRAYYLLRSRGFSQLYRYSGGLEEWVEAGYPVEGA